MIAAAALIVSLLADNSRSASDGEFAEAWRSYRYAEYDARGGYKCARRERRLLASAFDRRFGERVAVLRNMAVKRLGKPEAEQGLDVILTCEISKPTMFADPSWSRTYFDTFQATLLTAEAAFGVRGREQ